MLLLRIFFVIPVLLLLGGWLILAVFRALQRGEANAAGTRVVFRERIIFFTVTVLVQLGFGIIVLWEAGKILMTVIRGN
jgi:hypothetical protein